MPETLSFLVGHWQELLTQTVQHVYLTLIALVLAVLVALPLGLWLTRQQRAAGAILGIAGVIQTIPSLALLGFLIPLTGIGAPPAIIALFLYALLPIISNTYAGVTGVDRSVKEAAVGMGMSDAQALWHVEIPLAMPIIFTGIRTATVINVGIATLCALIGAGGLGVYIFRGISLNNTPMIFAGALPAATLALVLDGVLALAQKRLRQRLKPLLAVTLLLVGLTTGFRLMPAAGSSPSFKIGVPAEFMERADGYAGLVGRYDLVAAAVEMEHGLMYKALHAGDVDAVIGYSTDGEIAAFELVTLEDDRHYFPPYYVAPVVRGKILREHPELRTALAKLDGTLDEEHMARLNARVDQDREAAAQVAQSHLASLGLSTRTHRRARNADVTIGSKIFAEQYILAEMYALLVENYTTLSVRIEAGLGGTKICFDALANGEIDLYPEYSGTGLLAILKVPAAVRDSLIRDRQAVYDYVKQRFAREYDLIWLAPHGFSNTYALILKRSRARALPVMTISELARQLDRM